MSNPWQCRECDGIFALEDLDQVKDPKPGSEVTWTVCPDCRAADQFAQLCDEPGCEREATCGTTVAGVYRRTCYDHSALIPRPADDTPASPA